MKSTISIRSNAFCWSNVNAGSVLLSICNEWSVCHPQRYDMSNSDSIGKLITDKNCTRESCDWVPFGSIICLIAKSFDRCIRWQKQCIFRHFKSIGTVQMFGEMSWTYLEMDNRPKTVSYWLNLFQRNPFLHNVLQFDNSKFTFEIHNVSSNSRQLHNLFFNYKLLQFGDFLFSDSIKLTTHRSRINTLMIVFHFKMNYPNENLSFQSMTILCEYFLSLSQ